MGVAMLGSLTRLLTGASLVLLTSISFIAVAPAHAPDNKVLKVGTLKLIHGISAYFYEKFVPPGYTVEVIPFESPTDGKNAVLTGTVDTCIHGIAAFILGAAAGEPVMIVASANNGGMAIMSGINTDIKTIKDLKGKKVAIWPGSTQEAIILERLRMEGMTIKDIQPIRLQFSDMAGALARGDVDAYVGAEPAGGISLANGTGKLVEYPYSTSIGPLNMIVSASQKAVKENPARIKLIVDMHRKAVEYAMANQQQIVDMAVAKLGQQKKSVELAVPNVELVWKVDDVFMQRANAYAKLMFENKQIRQEIDLKQFVTTQFQ
jgi:ABC-type nitrate/sulfonate/bicarbonate transport system substrate-binding protein